MAKPIEFDRYDAVASAMDLFWMQGYQGTSLNQLLDKISIGRGSFYAAFDDKRSLFLECLDLFYRRTRSILKRAINNNPAQKATLAFFRKSILDVNKRESSRGCMMVNAVLELAETELELSRKTTTYHLSE